MVLLRFIVFIRIYNIRFGFLWCLNVGKGLKGEKKYMGEGIVVYNLV